MMRVLSRLSAIVGLVPDDKNIDQWLTKDQIVRLQRDRDERGVRTGVRLHTIAT